MERVYRVARRIITALCYAALTYVTLRFFLGFDVTRGQLLFASLVVIGTIAGIASYLIKLSVPVAVTGLLALRRVFRTSSANGDSNAPWRTLFDERMRTMMGRTAGIAVLAILLPHDPVVSYARANSRAVITVLYITDRQYERPSLAFSNSPGDDTTLSYGKALVLAPITQTDAISISYPVRRGKSPNYEVANGSITVMCEAVFFDYINSVVRASSTENQDFIFVHGFATPFNDALLRIAQLANDLKFKGVPIVFSWPSGNIYTVDKENAFWGAKHLGRSVYAIKWRTKPERMHLVAHSMGSLVLGSVMDGLALAKGAIDNVVFAAPDVNEALISRFAAAAKMVAKESRFTFPTRTEHFSYPTLFRRTASVPALSPGLGSR